MIIILYEYNHFFFLKIQVTGITIRLNLVPSASESHGLFHLHIHKFLWKCYFFIPVRSSNVSMPHYFLSFFLSIESRITFLLLAKNNLSIYHQFIAIPCYYRREKLRSLKRGYEQQLRLANVQYI